ncbi:zinc finger protein 423 [Anabrus simplex]|uniref:zinc finger protein 423 n=1 Tax=Anabrus simplex TaxID=316456 RepID=UPI0034DDAFF2
MAIGSGTNSNLVFECVQCKQQFVNENERDTHEQKTCHKVKERYLCPKCEKHFGNQHILQLHLRVHDSEQQQQVTVSPPQSLPLCDSNQLDNNSKDVTVKTSLVVSNKPSENCKPPALKMSSSILTAKKTPGLTKIRLEDCLRCDACSCIYIDKNDYNKHMKNFHRQNSPKKHNKQRKGCRSCCKHCNCQGEHIHQSIQKERGNNNLFHYNIKDRWTKMVSRRLSKIKKEIKSDPDSDSGDVDDVMDYSHLLSQVEVKIKTEPPDDECGDSL